MLENLRNQQICSLLRTGARLGLGGSLLAFLACAHGVDSGLDNLEPVGSSTAGPGVGGEAGLAGPATSGPTSSSSSMGAGGAPSSTAAGGASTSASTTSATAAGGRGAGGEAG